MRAIAHTSGGASARAKSPSRISLRSIPATWRAGAIRSPVTARCSPARRSGPPASFARRAASPEPILFWSRCPEWGWLSNFAAAGFAGPGGSFWPSVEHWYQAGKAEEPAAAEHIRRAATAREAQRLGRAVRCRAGWDDAKLARMAEGLLLRFAPQRPDTARLLATGERALRHATPWGAHGDPFWGIGRDGAGANRLGRMLEGIRTARRDGAPLDAATLAGRVR